METLKDHLKTVAYIVGFAAAISLVTYLFVTFGEIIFVGIACLMGIYVVYSIYTGVLKEVRETRKRKEYLKNVQENSI